MDRVPIEDLPHTGREPPAPVCVVLGEGDELNVGEWLRILPGRRYTGRAKWGKQEVLAKLFVGRKAIKMASAEHDGIERLHRANLPTPALSNLGMARPKKAAWVLTAFLPEACPLSQEAGLSLEARSNLPCCPEAVLDASKTIARMHNRGLMQHDIHPGNFIHHENNCLLVDAAEVQYIGRRNSLDRIVGNLGKWLAQLPEDWWPEIFQAYTLEAAERPGYSRVRKKAIDWRAWRARDLALKSMRDCSLFRAQSIRLQSISRRFISCWRSEYDDLEPILLDPDEAMAGAELLKKGGTATVGRLTWNGRQLIIKRYNIKNRWHRLSRALRPSRARHSWIAGHRLRTLGIDTPRPIAIIEERWWFFWRRSFLIMEYCAGENLADACRGKAGRDLGIIVGEIARVFELFGRHNIIHGDLKATNLLWDDRLLLIDLDAVSLFKSRGRWKRSCRGDIARLLKNWPEGSEMWRLLADVLRSEGDSSVIPGKG